MSKVVAVVGLAATGFGAYTMLYAFPRRPPYKFRQSNSHYYILP
jgi:hypothetical protein